MNSQYVVHSILLFSFGFHQPQLLRSGSNEQRTENSQLEQDGNLRVYLDRNVSFDVGTDSSLEAGEVPRVFNSKSHHVLEGGMHIGSWQKHVKKGEVKLRVLQDKLDELLDDGQNAAADAEKQAQRDKYKDLSLAERLKKMRDEGLL